MTPDNTPHTNLVPTSSHLVPKAGDDVRSRPRPSSPSPTGDEVELRVHDEHTETIPSSSPGRGQTQDLLAALQASISASRQHRRMTADRSSETPRAGGHQ